MQFDSVKLVSSTMSRGNLLFLLSGSIACYKACTVISRLAQAGVTVQTVATPAALRFVGAATLEGLSGRPVFTDLFESGRALDHMWDHPATARSLGQLRNWGVRVLDPVDGAHACGENGPGRLVDPEQIAADVLTALSKK